MGKAISLTGMRSFVAVCEAGGVRAAADQIGRTPSAVSMTLKQLEDDIGRRFSRVSAAAPYRRSAESCSKKRARWSPITIASARR